MALDLIKEYLVGIGFKVDNSSFGEANSSINQAQDNIKKFNKNNEKGFSESGNSLKDLFSLFNIFSQGIGKLSPELRAPFQNMIKDILVLARIYSQFNEQFKKQNTPNREKEEQPKSNSKEQPTQNNNINRKGLIITPDDSSNGLIDNILNIKEATKKMESEGGEAVSKFSLGAVAKFALVTTAAVAVVAGIAKIISGLFDLAKQDIENEKLSRQLWTTKENAKEVDMAMKTLGVSMQDLWLSPTLLKQFNQLRQDSVALKLPKEYTDNLKVVQGIGLEFSRLRQLGTLAFQWIGNYILKYAAGPLNDIKQGTKEFNEWLIKNIPGIAKVIGTVIGTIIRMLLTIIETIGFILSTIGKLISYISSKIPESGKEIIKIITLIGVTIMAGPVGAIIILILLIEDVMTYFKGGKSVIGSFFDKIKQGMNSIKDGWDYYYKKAVGVFDGIYKKYQEFIKAIKDFFPDLWGKAKDLAVSAGDKVKKFVGNVNINSIPASYANPSINNTSRTTTSNSNNKSTTSNTFNVYGTNPTATANAVAGKVTGLKTRNAQGVF